MRIFTRLQNCPDVNLERSTAEYCHSLDEVGAVVRCSHREHPCLAEAFDRSGNVAVVFHHMPPCADTLGVHLPNVIFCSRSDSLSFAHLAVCGVVVVADAYNRLKLSLKTSPLWPSTGRLALYGGIVAMLILQVNARVMCSDYRIVNEIFLTMFRGVIDVGLPYFLLLWANRRINESTPPVGVLLGAYSAGAIASMGFNALDKCFTQMGFAQVVATQLEKFENNWKSEYGC